jgi:glycolate oxidase
MMPTTDRVLLDLSGLNRILEVDVDNWRARVEPGVINSDLQERLAPHGLCFSPDPVSAHLATVAGNIIENAGGPHALKYGVTYNHILSAEVVLADGSTVTLSADDDGPDLLGVFIGSEGTLGIVTEATVALRPIAEVTQSLMGAFATARAAADTGYPLDADAIVLIDVDGTAAEVARDQPIVEKVLRERATEVRVAEDDKARTALWYGRLNAPNSVKRSGKGFFIGDVTVPRQRIPDMQEAIQAAAALEAANNEIIEAALGLGGTITGEHGVGTEKRQFMTKRFTPTEIAAQRSIKKAFDPAGLLNPGIMLPDYSPEEPDANTFGAAVRAAVTRRLKADPAAPLTTGGNCDITVNLGNLSLIVGADATIEEINRYLEEHGVTCAAITTSGGHRDRRRTDPRPARSSGRRRHRRRRPGPGPLRWGEHEGRRRLRHQTPLHGRARRLRRPDDSHLQDRCEGLSPAARWKRSEAGLPRSLPTVIVWSRRRFVKGVSTARSGA